MPLNNHALYQIATKGLLFKDDRILILVTPNGYLDFPGGRVDESERAIPWSEALRREVAEELGDSISIEIGQTLFVSKRQYQSEGTTHYIAAIFFKCQYVSGDIVLSEEHDNYAWLTPQEIVTHELEFVSQDEKEHLIDLFNETIQK